MSEILENLRIIYRGIHMACFTHIFQWAAILHQILRLFGIKPKYNTSKRSFTSIFGGSV